MRIGTIHSLCHRLLAPHVGLAGLRLDSRVLDEHEQHMLLHQEFDAIFGPDWDIPSGRGWRDGVHTVAEAGRYFFRISGPNCTFVIEEAVVDPNWPTHIHPLGQGNAVYLALPGSFLTHPFRAVQNQAEWDMLLQLAADHQERTGIPPSGTIITPAHPHLPDQQQP